MRCAAPCPALFQPALFHPSPVLPLTTAPRPADWNEAEEEQKDRDLWEDNWDDDNVEDDFSVQLRAELEKQQRYRHSQRRQACRGALLHSAR